MRSYISLKRVDIGLLAGRHFWHLMKSWCEVGVIQIGFEAVYNYTFGSILLFWGGRDFIIIFDRTIDVSVIQAHVWLELQHWSVKLLKIIVWIYIWRAFDGNYSYHFLIFAKTCFMSKISPSIFIC